MQINSDENSEVEGHLPVFCFLLRLLSLLRETVISTLSVLVDNCDYPTEVFLRFLKRSISQSSSYVDLHWDWMYISLSSFAWEKLFSRSLSRSSSGFPEFNNRGTVVIRCSCDVAGRRMWTTVIMLYVDYMDLRWPWKDELSSGSFCTYFSISSTFRDVQLLLRHMFMYGLVDSFVHSIWERR